MRGGSRLREGQTQKKGLHPLWRGIGCFIMVIFTVGGYFLTGALVTLYLDAAKANPGLPQIPIPRYEIVLGPWKVPASGTVIPAIPFSIDPAQVMLTLVVMLIGYSLVVIMWGLVNPVKLGPTDAPPIHRKIDRSKVR